MELELTEKQRSLQLTIREFAETELRPNAVKREETGEFPREAIRKLGRMGVFGLIFPAEYGGKERDLMDYAVAVEELARYDASAALSLIAHTLCATHINTFGSPSQKERYLFPLAVGEKLGAWAFAEPGAEKNPGRITSLAVEGGDGWRISGSKSYVTNGAQAEIFVILAATNDTGMTGGVSAFLVPGDAHGLGKSDVPEMRGFRSSGTVSLVLNNLRVPRGNLLGCENQGLIQVAAVRAVSRIGVAAMAVGAGRGSLNESITQAGGRPFHSQAAAEFQAAQWTLDHKSLRSRNLIVSQREQEVLEWLKEGKSSWDIAMILGISERTVYFHVSNIMKKLGASNRAQAVAIAASLGLIDMTRT